MNTKITGKISEDLVVQYLIKNNFQILKRNFFWSKYEIDIICTKNNIIHLIEVKTVKFYSLFKLTFKQKQAYETFILKYYPNQFVNCYIAIVNNKSVQLIPMEM